MKPLSLMMTVVTALIAATTSPAGAQSQTEANAEQPKVFHAGGRHDEFSHRAALRAQRAADEAAKR